MLEKMKEIIGEQLNVDAQDITETTSFKEDLGADSLDLFELVMALEEEFNVEIPSEDLENLTTVGAVMEYLKSRNVSASSIPLSREAWPGWRSITWRPPYRRPGAWG